MNLKSTVKNTVYMYVLTVAKIIFPLLTLPYLTRVLSLEGYAVVSYIRACMTYINVIVDFGFLYSSTKNVIEYSNEVKKIDLEISQVTGTKIILGLFSLTTITLLGFNLPILKENFFYAFLSTVGCILTGLLPDYLYRALGYMHLLTNRFVMVKVISTLLTFFIIRGDSDILWIPILDIIGAILAFSITLAQIHKMGFHIIPSQLFHGVIKKLKESWDFFVSSAAPTAYGAFNTVMIGAMLSESDVAYWSLVYNVIAAGLNLYSPLMNGIYPYMVKQKSWKLIRKILVLFVPPIVVALFITFIWAEPIMVLVGGKKYSTAAVYLKLLLPVLLFAFPSMLFGFPTLGATNHIHSVLISTVVSAILHIVLLCVTAFTGFFTLSVVCLIRCFTELLNMIIKCIFLIKYRKDFAQ
ncbi:oligosaccharide flippase family protein [Ruthenibacterium lactatiformans]|uniref:oligosaccharide flippase family protein n=1 Tax=Ruthenibacterium lactatiformans TaxID=1550024 RepID=UPI00294278E9|nr:oligosaccharide flippase family protein [Ruthenibacterium lactatiformans]